MTETLNLVFYTTDLFHSGKMTGGNRRFLELIYGLLEKGDTVHVFAPDQAHLPAHPNLIRHQVKRMESRVFPNGLLNFVLNYFRLRSIRKINADGIFLMSVPYGIQGVLAGLKNIILLIREDFLVYRQHRYQTARVIGLFSVLFLQIMRKIERFTLRHVQRIGVQCHYDKRKLQERHQGIRQKLEAKTFIVKNNVNPSWIKERNILVHQWKRVKNRNYALTYLGNLNNRIKGAHLLLEASKILLDWGYPVELHVMGEGKLKQLYAKQYANYQEIMFYGHVADPMNILRKYNLLVVTSLSDSFPNSLMEGLYLEMPVLGARSGGIPEMLVYDDLLVQPDSQAIYKRIASVIDSNEWEHLKELSGKRKRALSFDWVAEMRKLALT